MAYDPNRDLFGDVKDFKSPDGIKMLSQLSLPPKNEVRFIYDQIVAHMEEAKDA